MTRPRKQNVDYFPHYCKHGKVLFVLESKYGNDGYAFFYKLLEALGDADGHFIDCSKPAHLEYLTAVSGAKTPQSVTDILNTLSALEIIDQKLWDKRVIWMQSFVDSIQDVYRKRSQSAPVMPLLTPEIHISAPETPQESAKDSKGKDSKGKKTKEVIIPDGIKKEIWEAFVEMRKIMKAPLTLYASELIISKLKKLSSDNGNEMERILQQSIANNWKGVFPLKEGKYGTGTFGSAGTPVKKAGRAEGDGKPYPVDHEF